MENYWNEISHLSAKEHALIRLENFRAGFGDLFVLNIDPGRELPDEDPSDNYYRIEFQTGQITGITQTLCADNVYLQDVSVFNPIEVNTAGSVACVELHANNRVFVDNTPEDGFITLVDMGLLSPERNFIRVYIYGYNGVVLDSRKLLLLF